MIAIPTMQPRPPEITETVVPAPAATKPASALPRRGPLLTRMGGIALGRPGRRSGVGVWMRVPRIIEAVMSQPPAIARQTMAGPIQGIRPKTVIAAPQPAERTLIA